jgi:hypothetical protein
MILYDLYVILIEFGGYACAYHTHFPIEETNDDQASIKRDIVVTKHPPQKVE